MITASAPGKLMLAGEYAVVGGHGPALAVALNARATVRLEPGGAAWRVSSVDLGLREGHKVFLIIKTNSITVMDSARPGAGSAGPPR